MGNVSASQSRMLLSTHRSGKRVEQRFAAIRDAFRREEKNFLTKQLTYLYIESGTILNLIFSGTIKVYKARYAFSELLKGDPSKFLDSVGGLNA